MNNVTFIFSRSAQISTIEFNSLVVMQWLDAHPTYLKNILYIGGDSYSGMPVPMLAQTIINGKSL